MSQVQTASLHRTIAASPLMLSDRLLSLAQDAGRAGLQLTADRLVMLAHSVFDEVPPASADVPALLVARGANIKARALPRFFERGTRQDAARPGPAFV